MIHQNFTAIAPKLLKLYCSVDISAAFCLLSCIHFIYIYRKTPVRRRAPHTGRESDSLVPIEAGPRLQPGSLLPHYKPGVS